MKRGDTSRTIPISPHRDNLSIFPQYELYFITNMLF